jgi:drug/metabolite transporter (DMT)-like permease
LLRKKFQAIFYIVGAGVLFGFVATLAKVVIDRVKTLSFSGFRLGDAEWLTVLCVVGMLVAVLLGSYFVQSAYSNGPPDLVVAGLTVIDPLVAIAIGIIVLGEASKAPLWATFAFIVAGAIAIFGVVSLARNHPQLQH